MHLDAAEMAGEIYRNASAVRESQQPVNFWEGLAEGLVNMTAARYVDAGSKGGPAGILKQAGEDLSAGYDYARGIYDKTLGPDVGRDAEGNALGPVYSPEGQDNSQFGSTWNKVKGWVSEDDEPEGWQINRGGQR
jgi:hypothetical protein